MVNDPESVDSEKSLPRETAGFRLESELGRGGMGVVFRAEELSSGRTVALKVLDPEFAVSGEGFERFQREARLAAAISHPSCVFVYGAHQVEGSPAISMELVGGQTVEQRIASGEVPIETATRWAIELIDGLEAARRAGVVHRDVKPSNCFLTADGHLKVGDFGLSRSLGQDIQLTQAGAFLGSPLFASPEQVRGREVDFRTDMYSAGATLYALLSGEGPFGGAGVGEVLARITSENPTPLRELRPEVPRKLEKAVMRALERDPKKRFRSFAAFRRALEPMLPVEQEPAGRAGRFAAYMIDVLPLSLVIQFLVTLSGLEFASVNEMVFSAEYLIFTTLFTIAYFGLFEGLWGTTPGKWLFGQRVVTVEGGARSLPRALARAALFFSVNSLVPFVAFRIITGEWGIISDDYVEHWFRNMTLPYVGYVVVCATMWRRTGYRGLHDLATGMRVVRGPSPLSRRTQSTELDLETTLSSAEGLPAEVGPYSIEGRVADTPGGPLMQARDAHLDRAVWIRERQAEDSPDSRSQTDSRRLRWLDAQEEGGVQFDVYEAPGGASLGAYVARGTRLPWSSAQPLLAALTGELADSAEAREGEAIESRSLDQVWVDSNGGLKLIDFPMGEGDRLDPAQLLEQTARTILLTGAPPKSLLPCDLPSHAEPGVRRLLGLDPAFETAREASEVVQTWKNRPAVVTGLMRALQTGIWVAPIVFMVLITLIMVPGVMGASIDSASMRAHIRQQVEWEAMQAPREESAGADPTEEEDPQRRARLISIADLHRKVPAQFLAQNTQELDAREREILEEALRRFPTSTEDEVSAALERFPPRRDTPYGKIAGGIVIAFGICGEIFILPLAFLLRGGLSFLLVGIHLRDRRGRRASRLRCTWRSLLCRLPVELLVGVGIIFCTEAGLLDNWREAGRAMGGSGLVLVVAGLLLLGWELFSIWRDPARSLVDRVAGTYLVPR